MIKILAVILAALMVVLGVHLVFEVMATVTFVAVLAVAGRVMENGMRCVPRPRVVLA